MNKSWYKNTWLGKKLGCKIDWSTENLVHKDNRADRVRVLFEYDEYVYVGTKKYIRSHYDKDVWTHDIVDDKEIIYKDNINLSEWYIEYDQTKVEALKRISKIEEDTRYKREVETTWIEVNRTYDLNKMAEFKLSPEFYREAAKYILKEEIVSTVNCSYEYRLICTRDNVSMLSMLYRKHMK